MPDISCQRCLADLNDTDRYQCSHSCTFCADCAWRLDDICPNCGGRLTLAAASRK
jgi:uncharacterized protein